MIPDDGRHIWDWFHELNSFVSRFFEGYYRQIPMSEYYYWSKLSNSIIRPEEYDILFCMDRVFCEECNKEISSLRLQEQEKLESKYNG